MQVPYDWFAATTSTAPAYGPGYVAPRTYPSPAPSIDPSPGPLPHLSLQEPFIHRMNMTYNDVGPTRAISGRRQLQVGGGTGRYTEEQRMDVQPPYHAQSPSTSMASPYSPYPQRPFSEYFDGVRMPSPALSSGSGSGSGSASGRTPLSTGDTPDSPHHRSPSSPMPARRKVQKHTKHRLLAADRKAICLYHLKAKHARQEDIANQFGCERSTVSKILKHKERWLNIPEAMEESIYSAKLRGSKFPLVEEELQATYLPKWHNDGTIITDHLLRTTALEIAQQQGRSPDEFKASSGWLENFKHRHKIRRGEWLMGKDINKLKYGTEVAPQPSHSVSAKALPTIVPEGQPEAFNSPQLSRDSSTPDPTDFEGSMRAQTATKSSPSQRHGSNEEHLNLDPLLQSESVSGGSRSAQQDLVPVSESDLVVQNATEHYGKRMVPLFEPSADPEERLQQLRPPLNRPEIFPYSYVQHSANILASFFDNEGRGVLKPAEKRVLEHIRSALYHLEMNDYYER